MQRLTEALVPDDPDAAGDQEGAMMDGVSAIGMPKQSLDIDQPAAYQAAPFPTPDTQEVSGEPMSGDERACLAGSPCSCRSSASGGPERFTKTT